MKLYSVTEAARLFGCPGRKITRLIKAKGIAAILSPSPTGKNRRYYIKQKDLLKFAEQMKLPEVVAEIKKHK